MKFYLASFYLILICYFVKGQNNPILPNPILHRHSISFIASPYTYSKFWSNQKGEQFYTDYQSTTEIEKKTDRTKYHSFFSTRSGFIYSYYLRGNFALRSGILLSKEELEGIIISGYQNSNPYLKYINYSIRYFQVPLSASLRLFDNDKKLKSTNFTFELNFDFILTEKREYGYLHTIDQNGNTIKQDKLYSKTKYDPTMLFNRVTPNISLSREIYNNSRSLSFQYGINIQFESLYQLNKASEQFKIFKFTPLFIGFTHHFK